MQDILDVTACIMFEQNMQCRGPVWDGKNEYDTCCRYKFDMIVGTKSKMLYDPVGIFIPDGKYHPITEGLTFLEDLERYPYHFPDWMLKASQDKRSKKINLLSELQEMHDDITSWEEDDTAGEEMRKELKRIAKKHKLKVGLINKLEPGKLNYDLLEKEKTSKRKEGKRSKRR